MIISREYDDIIHLSRPVSRKHPPMSMADRAAQFSPFAALTGYGEAISDTTHRTEEELEQLERDNAISDELLSLLLAEAGEG